MPPILIGNKSFEEVPFENEAELEAATTTRAVSHPPQDGT